MNTNRHHKILFFIVLFSVLFRIIGRTQNNTFQQHKFERITTEDGLSFPAVRDILQDRSGFLWFATDQGLNRYDGYGFKIFPEEGDTTIKGSNFRCIIENEEGKIWIGAIDIGLHSYDPINNLFKSYSHISQGKSSNHVIRLFQGRNNLVWIGTAEGLKCFNPVDEKEVVMEREAGVIFPFDTLRVTAIMEDQKGFLWVGTQKGLNKFDPVLGKNVTFIHNPSDPKSISHNDIASVIEDKFGNIWIGTLDGGMNQYISDSHFIHYMYDENAPTGIPSNRISKLFEDDGHFIWVGTRREGLALFNSASKQFEHYPHSPDDPESIGDGLIWDILKDKSGILWVALHGGGIGKLNTLKSDFVNHEHQTTNSNSLSNNTVLSFAETEDGTIWVGTWGGGLNAYNPLTGNFKAYLPDPNNPYSLTQDLIRYVHAGGSGGVWVSTHSGRVNYFDGEKFHLIDYHPDEPEIDRKSSVGFIVEGKKGDTWLGHYRGFTRYNMTTKKFKHYKIETSHSDKGILSVLKTRDGNIWLSSEAGLYQYDEGEDRFVKIEVIKGKNEKVHFAFEDRDGIMWLSIMEYGLVRYDRSTGTYRNYAKEDGLTNGSIMCMLEDGSKNLWLGTTGGIFRFDKSTEKFTHYTTLDGLPDNAFFLNSCCKSEKTGRMYFGGTKGFTEFHPDSIHINSFIPPVRFINMQKYSGKGEGINSTIIGHPEIYLSPQEKLFTLEFAALDFHNPPHNQYQYQLDNFDESPINIGNKRELTFSNLSPGNHILKIKGSNGRGILGNSAELTIKIAPPWHRTWWAYIIWSILFLLILFGIYRFLLTRRLAEQETKRLKELDALKSRLYTNITHEFRTPLTVILGMVEQVKSDPKNWFSEGLQLIRRNGKQLLHLVNQLLDLSKLESGNMPLHYIHGDVVAFLKYLSESFHSYADSKDIRLHFLSDLDQLMMDHDPEKLQNILSNLLSNAIKFTPAGGDIYLRVEKNGADDLRISVQDTGEGIGADGLPHIFDRFYQVDTSSTRRGEGTGIGLSLCRELVRLMGGEITVKSEVGKGSHFTIHLPILREHKNLAAKNEMELPAPLANTILPDEPKPVTLEDFVPSDKRPLVLLVEDNPDVITYLTALLSTNYDLLTATDGQKGIELAIEQVPDLIVSDVMMPEKDGFEVCATLKTDERTSHIPIILLTAKSDERAKLEGLTHGADAYLAKPFSKEELLVRMEKMIELRERLRAQYGQQGKLRKWVTEKLPSPEVIFLKKAIRIVEDNLADEFFGAPELGKKLSMSRTQLFRKLKAVTGKSAAPFIRSIRLEKAKELLETTDLNVSEVGYDTGFANPAYFSRAFQQEFGMPPSSARKPPEEN